MTGSSPPRTARTRTAPGTGSRTMADLVPRAAERYGPSVALRFKEDGVWKPVSYSALWEAVSEVGRGLLALGLRPGAKVAILAHSRPEWTYAHFGILAAGGVSVSVYQTNSPEECRHVLGHSGAEFVFVEDAEQWEKIAAVRSRLQRLREVIAFDPVPQAPGALTLGELRRRGRTADSAAFETGAAAIEPERPCLIMYTSGTTGAPKGCVLTHGNYRAVVDMIAATGTIVPDDRVYLFLPLAHAFAAVVQFLSLDLGASIAFWEKDPDRIIPNLLEVRPTYFPSVPRIFEKVYARATALVADPERLRKAVETGKRVRALTAAGQEVPEEVRADFDDFDKELYANVRGMFGGGIRQCTSGAAPIAQDILEFFHACGVPVLEAYGLTETATVSTVNSLREFRHRSVGRPLPGVEARIADDGELLLRGGQVFQGYHDDQPSTDQVLDADGWFRTGDLASIDEDGYVFITGRKKDLIITAGGKNIAPARAENALKESAWISQAVLVGDLLPYLVVLITLDQEELDSFAAAHDMTPEEAVRSPETHAAVRREIDRVNAQVGRVEQIKRFAILPRDLTVEAGELTVSFKVRRAQVLINHKEVIQSLYDTPMPG
ncbi:AMP-dependent synthetase/ligase [Streptomyces sp. NPDC088789]|uniref:AMP-dependent synthetase/ligase n=1 Tax=Streptomyces sp. NPDC088789 TaxID=3365899 RepID=UPI003806CB97